MGNLVYGVGVCSDVIDADVVAVFSEFYGYCFASCNGELGIGWLLGKLGALTSRDSIL